MTNYPCKLLQNAPHQFKVEARLLFDIDEMILQTVESSWTESRQKLARVIPRMAIDHSHWNWCAKWSTIQSGFHRVVAISHEEQFQGAMALLTKPAITQSGEPLLYIDYLESAPWNLSVLKNLPSTPPRYLGVGTALVVGAIQESLRLGWNGRIGLHALPTSEGFYRALHMTASETHWKHGLRFFEYNSQDAIDLLRRLGDDR